MKFDLKLKFRYQYQIALVLATNEEIRLDDIRSYISKAVDDYNASSKKSKNIKEINKWSIDSKKDMLLVSLNSYNALPTPSRALRLFTQLIIKNMEDAKKDEWLEKLIVRSSLFKCVGAVEEPREIMNLKLEDVEEKKETSSIKNEEEVKEKDISIENLFKIIEKLEKRIEKIEEVLGI